MAKRMKSLVHVFFFIMLLCSWAAAQSPPPANLAVITSISQGGLGYVTYSGSSGGIDASIGRWDTPYPNGLNGDPAPGLEPTGASILNIDVDVHDGGLASFSYKLKAWDAGRWDWLDISVQTPSGTVSIINHLGKPGGDYG